MKEAKETLQTDLQQLERLVVAPTIDFIALLDIIKRYIVKRSHKLLDYDRYGDSVKNLREKPNRSISDEKKLMQMEATFDQASRDYNSINNTLKSELSIFLGYRKDFINPCLLVFYNYQVKVYETLYRIYYQVGSTQFDLSSTALSGYQHVQEELAKMLGSLTVLKGLAKPSGVVETPKNSQTAPPSYSQQLAGQTNMAGALSPSDGGKSINSSPTKSSSTGAGYSRPVSLDKTKSYVMALYDFEPQTDGDLGFRKGDRIEVVERKEDINDWWVGRIDERIGSFPGNYVSSL